MPSFTSCVSTLALRSPLIGPLGHGGRTGGVEGTSILDKALEHPKEQMPGIDFLVGLSIRAMVMVVNCLTHVRKVRCRCCVFENLSPACAPVCSGQMVS